MSYEGRACRKGNDVRLLGGEGSGIPSALCRVGKILPWARSPYSTALSRGVVRSAIFVDCAHTYPPGQTSLAGGSTLYKEWNWLRRGIYRRGIRARIRNQLIETFVQELNQTFRRNPLDNFFRLRLEDFQEHRFIFRIETDTGT